MNDTACIALPGELWGVYPELYKEKWPRYIESALYRDTHNLDKAFYLDHDNPYT